MEFRKPYETYPTRPSPSGSGMRKKYREIIDDNGSKTLVEDGETDQYRLIQEAYEATKIDNIIRRFTMGDTEILNKVQGVYEDVSTAPTSLMEAHQRIRNIENQFGQLPADVKELFNNNPAEYIADMANGNGITKIQSLFKTDNILTPEVITKEVETVE